MKLRERKNNATIWMVGFGLLFISLSSQPAFSSDISEKCVNEANRGLGSYKSKLITFYNCARRNGVPAYELTEVEEKIRDIEDREQSQMRGYNAGAALGHKLICALKPNMAQCQE